MSHFKSEQLACVRYSPKVNCLQVHDSYRTKPDSRCIKTGH